MRTKFALMLLGSVSLAIALPACRASTDNKVEAVEGSNSGINLAAMDKAVKPGDDPRSGRWWWENADTRECGLHVDEEAGGSGI